MKISESLKIVGVFILVVAVIGLRLRLYGLSGRRPSYLRDQVLPRIPRRLIWFGLLVAPAVLAVMAKLEHIV